jgi:hypothetical protein
LISCAALRRTDRAFQPTSASARYFIIKRRVSWLMSQLCVVVSPCRLCLRLRSYNHENIGTSISNGVWATQAHNEKKLADAFDSGEEARRAPAVDSAHLALFLVTDSFSLWTHRWF